MTDRLSINRITSNQLDRLYDERDRAEATLTRIRAYLNSPDRPCCGQVQRTLRGIIDGPAEQPRTTPNNPATSATKEN